MNTNTHLTADRVRLAIQSAYHPIAGLTFERLTRQLAAYHAGFLRDIALTWEAIENRDIYLKNVAMKRKKAVARNGWEILTLDDSPEAQRQKAALEFFYNHLTVTHALDENERGGLSLLIRQMMDAVGKGHAVHEILWKPEPAKAGTPSGGMTAELRFVPLWFFENTTGRLRFLESEFALAGAPLEENGWLVTAGDAIMEPCAIAYLFKSRPLSDWVRYCELFGTPAVIGKTTAAKDSDDWKAMQAAVDKIICGGNGVFQTTESVELLEPKAGGDLPFPALVEYMDRAMASIWRGSDLSTLSRSSSVGASLQGDEAIALQEDDAQLISEALNTQVDRAVIQYLFGDVPGRAYLKVLAPQRQNIDQDLRVDEFLTKHAAPLTVTDALERYGRPVPNPGEAVLKPMERTNVQ